jgi:hypothetical protein
MDNRRGSNPWRALRLSGQTKILYGMESIGRLYGNKGWIDVTAEPDTTVEENGMIDVLVKVDEGGQ